jgi:hypothetical protein
MIMRWILLVLAALASISSAHANELLKIEHAAFFLGSTFAPSPTNPTFTPLHTFFIAPAGSGGSDSNNGLTAGTPWLSPNHAVVCGDVIIAAAGAYNSANFDSFTAGSTKWGAVSGCPSTTGGIDGAGGIYVATVLCATFDACTINASTQYTMDVSASNWAVEGFQGSNTNNGDGECFQAQPLNVTNIAFVAFINDIAVHCPLQGFGSGGFPGSAINVDEFAAVGDMAFDAAASASECGSPFGILGPANVAALSGTHIFFSQDFAFGSINGPCSPNSNFVGQFNSVSGTPTTGSPNLTVATTPSGWGANWPIGATSGGSNYPSSSAAIPQPTFVSSVSGDNVTLSNNIASPGLTNTQLLVIGTSTDGECWIGDTLGGNTYTGQVVVKNFAGWGCGGNGIQPFCNSTCSTSMVVDMANITIYGVGHDYKRDGVTFGFYDNNQNTSLHYSLTNSIFQMDATIPPNSRTEAAWNGTTGVGHAGTGQAINAAGFGDSTAVAVTGNYFFSAPGAACAGGTCDSGNNISQFFGTGFATGNTLSNPGLAAPGSLPTTAPNCSSFTDVVTCMNTGNSVAADLASSASPTTGYQVPGPCAADALYPTWLKGIVYLQLTGTTITENAGLVTKPCGM